MKTHAKKKREIKEPIIEISIPDLTPEERKRREDNAIRAFYRISKE